jgi:large subunit ribosomal protein L25
MIQLIRRELDIICRPADAPESILLDITALEVGDSIHVEDIDMGDNIEIPHEVNFTVITVVPPTASEKEVSEEDDEDMDEAVAASTEE